MESLVLQTSAPEHTISLLYKALITDMYTSPLPYLNKWERDLGRTLSKEERDKTFLLTHKLSISAADQEKNYKVLTCWYKCPSDLHAIDSSISSTC